MHGIQHIQTKIFKTFKYIQTQTYTITHLSPYTYLYANPSAIRQHTGAYLNGDSQCFCSEEADRAKPGSKIKRQHTLNKTMAKVN